MQAYKSPAHFMWAAIGFTKKLAVDCHHKNHIVRNHYSNNLTVSSCNLNWFDTTVIYGAEQPPVCAATYYSMQVFERSCALLTSAISCTRAVRIPSSTCTNRLLLAALEEPEDSGTTQVYVITYVARGIDLDPKAKPKGQHQPEGNTNDIAISLT